MKNILDEKTGFLFPPTSKFVGQIAFVVGVLAIFLAPLTGFFFAAVGAYVGFSKSGVLLNPEAGTYQDYVSVFGLRFGKHKSYSEYPFLSVMRNKITSKAFSITNRNTATGSDLFYDVYLLNQSHRKRVLVRRYSNLHDAKTSAQDLGKQLSKDIVMYSPVVSAATRSRR